MKVLVCGSRSLDNYELLASALGAGLYWCDDKITLIHGGAKGADLLAANYAKDMGWEQVEYKPNWDKYGRSAGMIRNEQMVREADAVWAFWDGDSPGTRGSIEMALRYQKELHVIFFSISAPSEQQHMTFP